MMASAATRGRARSLFWLLLAAATVEVQLGFEPKQASAQSTEKSLPASAAADRKKLAEARYQSGVESFRARRYREAADHFETADELFPSAAYSYNVALALDKLGDTGGALYAYRQYLRRRLRAPNTPAVLDRIRALEQKLADQGLRQITVISRPSGAAVSIDGASVGTTPWTGEIPPGRHRVRIDSKGYAPVVTVVDLASTRARDLDFRLARTTEAAPSATRTPVKTRKKAPKAKVSEAARPDHGA
jgi:tetratricopeptide (TPR) repeat protein